MWLAISFYHNVWTQTSAGDLPAAALPATSSILSWMAPSLSPLADVFTRSLLDFSFNAAVSSPVSSSALCTTASPTLSWIQASWQFASNKRVWPGVATWVTWPRASWESWPSLSLTESRRLTSWSLTAGETSLQQHALHNTLFNAPCTRQLDIKLDKKLYINIGYYLCNCIL